ncbi:nuclear transport factor 2 family protein [Desertibaculum subflavum]|uniref:nuclear transport factor 2 family protein n=1 Tax=Desertibaculum subflavum TaxID=2268458 RepID=UPI000E66E83C
MPSAEEMIATAETYFARVDAGEVESVTTLMTPDAMFQVVTHGIRLEGRDAIADMFRRRLANFANGWHGNFRHLADPARGWLVSRFDVVRNHRDGRRDEMDNMNFFEFSGPLISRISVWMAHPENSLK